MSTDIAAPLLPSNNIRSSQETINCHDGTQVENTSRLRTFTLGALFALSVTFIGAVAIVCKAIFFEETPPQGLVERTEYAFLDIVAHLGYSAHFIVCTSWLMILLALSVSETRLSDIKDKSAVRAIVFLGGLFYGMTLVAMHLQIYFLRYDYSTGSFWLAVLGDLIHQGILLAAMYDAFRIKKVKEVINEEDAEDSSYAMIV